MMASPPAQNHTESVVDASDSQKQSDTPATSPILDKQHKRTPLNFQKQEAIQISRTLTWVRNVADAPEPDALLHQRDAPTPYQLACLVKELSLILSAAHVGRETAVSALTYLRLNDGVSPNAALGQARRDRRTKYNDRQNRKSSGGATSQSNKEDSIDHKVEEQQQSNTTDNHITKKVNNEPDCSEASKSEKDDHSSSTRQDGISSQSMPDSKLNDEDGKAANTHTPEIAIDSNSKVIDGTHEKEVNSDKNGVNGDGEALTDAATPSPDVKAVGSGKKKPYSRYFGKGQRRFSAKKKTQNGNDNTSKPSADTIAMADQKPAEAEGDSKIDAK